MTVRGGLAPWVCNVPIVSAHWQGLYLQPMAAYLSEE